MCSKTIVKMQIFPCRISSWRPTGATREQPAAASSCVCDSVSCCSQVCRVRSAASSNGQYSNARCAGKAAYNEEMSRSFPGLFYDFVWMDFRLSVDKTAKRLTSTNIAKQKNAINRLAAKGKVARVESTSRSTRVVTVAANIC